MNKSLIHFSGDDYWNSNPHSRYHIVKALHKRGYKVLWLNPVGHRFPSINKKGFTQRISRKLRSYFRLLKEEEKAFYVFTPVLLPKFSAGISHHLNFLLLSFQVIFLKILLSFKDPLFFITTPVFGEAVKFHHSKSIYYYSDKYTSYRELTSKNKGYLEKLDRQLYRKSDLICCASENIYKEVKELTDKPVIYIPHSVNFEFFNNALKEKYIPDDIANISKPVVGYYGTLTKSTDWELIEYCAKERPNYSFVLIGRDEENLPNIKKLHNIFLLGKKNFKEIPHYGKVFDICISPFIKEEWIHNSSPLKIKEFLSLEKPVVSTYIDEVEKLYPGIVYVAKNKYEFLSLIDQILVNPDSERIKRGKDLVKSESWDSVAEKLERLIRC